MNDQKQHVDPIRKLRLRKELMAKAGITTGNIYVPYIGEGDIAFELYQDPGMTVYGADIDQAYIDKAKSRLINCDIRLADCELGFPFEDKGNMPYVMADFDAYTYPYMAFRFFWQWATAKDKIVLFFTDGQKYAIKRSGSYRTPDGDKVKVATLNEGRRLRSFYYTKTILPWFEAYVKPWKIVYEMKYLRNEMIYWGVVLELSSDEPADSSIKKNSATDITEKTHIDNKDTYIDVKDKKNKKSSKKNKDNKDNGNVTNVSAVTTLHKEIDINIELERKGKNSGVWTKLDEIKKGEYVKKLCQGYRRGLAAAAIGVCRQTVINHLKKDKKFADVCSMAETMCNEKVEQSLYESALSGNIIAQQIWLYNRDPKRWADKRSFKISGEGGGPIEIKHTDVRDKILDRLTKIAAHQDKPLLKPAVVDNKQT